MNGRAPAPTPVSVPALPEEVTAAIGRAEEAERRAKWGAAREHYSYVLAVLSPGTDPAFTGRIVRQIARCHIEEAEFEQALDTLELAAAIADRSGDRAGSAHAVNLRGIAEWQRGNLAEAEAHYLQARDMADAIGAGAIVAMVLQNLGVIANIRGELYTARHYYEDALDTYERLGMESRIGPLLNNLGMLSIDLGEWQAAERSFAQAVTSSIAMGDEAGFLRAQGNRVELYLGLRRYRKAKRICRTILERSVGDTSGPWIGETYKHLAILYRETGDPVEARRCFARALSIAERREDQLLTGEVLREAAVLDQREGRTQEMLMSLNRAHVIFSKLRARRDLSDIARRLRTLESDFLRIVSEWGSSIESKDRYTQGHCERVADTGCALALDAGVPDELLLWFRMGALLHDVGKVVIPEAILNKQGPLDPDERLAMQEHPVAGERLVADAHFPLDVMPMIRHHHERWDGNGYPDRLVGTETPLWARILCIADVFDALTTQRSYRPAFTRDEALTIMRAESGRGFDPALLEVFLERTVPKLDPVAPAAAPVVWGEARPIARAG